MGLEILIPEAYDITHDISMFTVLTHTDFFTTLFSSLLCIPLVYLYFDKHCTVSEGNSSSLHNVLCIVVYVTLMWNHSCGRIHFYFITEKECIFYHRYSLDFGASESWA